MKKIVIPHTYTLLFVLIILMAILTWIIPSGSFTKVDKEVAPGVTQSVIQPGTYQSVEKVVDGTDSRQGVFDVLTAPAKGIQDAAQVIAFLFVLGGAFTIIMKTGAIDSGLARAASKLKGGKEKFIIPAIILIIGIGGSVIGTSEETIPLYLVFIPLMMKFGYDSLTSVMMIYLASQAGYVGSTLNPFSVLVAQGVAGIHGNPQLWFRCIQFVIYIGVTVGFVMLYANKVKKDPRKSLMYHDDLINREGFLTSEDTLGDVQFTTRHKIILAGFGAGIVFMVWGLMKKGFYMDEISAVFLAIGLFSGIVAGMSQKKIAEAFVEGCKDFAYAAIIVGVARAILVVAQNGVIIDTILNGMANNLKGLPTAAVTTGMLLVQNVICFLVPSSSGQAALTMPVMGPLADLLKINKEAAVTAYQAGNGITNFISPTGGVLMAALGIAKISIGKWVKSVIKYVLIIELLAIIFCAISAYLPA